MVVRTGFTVLSSATPRKRKSLEMHGVYGGTSRKRLKLDNQMNEDLKRGIQNLKKNMTEEKRQSYLAVAKLCSQGAKYGMKQHLKKKLGISYKIQKRATANSFKRKIRADKIFLKTQNQVQDFWLQAEISRPMPCKKDVKRGKPKYVLEVSLMEAYKKFRKVNPDVKIGFRKFVDFKPNNVKQARLSDRLQCLCIKCTNMKLLRVSVNRKVKEVGLKDLQVSSTKDLCELSLCKTDSKFPKSNCIQRRCAKCGPKLLNSYYKELLQKCEEDTVTFSQWNRRKVTVNKTINGKKTTKITSKLLREEYESPLSGVIRKILQQTETMAGHIFRAEWQQDQFRSIKEKIPPETALLVIDFAENYICPLNDEVQSYHFNQNQVTIHPIMCYVNDTQAQVGISECKKESIYVISDDRKHDSYAVKSFMSVVNKYLIEHYQIKNQIQFSDGCAAQYRSRHTFADLSRSNITITRHFFESSHGKSEADGLAAVLKNAVTRAVTNGATITNAEQFFKFCREKMTEVGDSVYPSRRMAYTNSTRTFFYVPSDQIDRHITQSFRSIPGILKIHSVKVVEKLKVAARELSCFCSGCMQRNGKCSNADYVPPWKEYCLHKL